MAFKPDGSYEPPDVATRHVSVAVKAFRLTRGGPHQFPVAAGTVTAVRMFGQTQIVALAEPMLQGPGLGDNMVWIEHETAKEGDVLPMDVVTPLVEAAKKKQEAVAAFRAKVEAERAKAAAANAVAPSNEPA